MASGGGGPTPTRTVCTECGFQREVKHWNLKQAICPQCGGEEQLEKVAAILKKAEEQADARERAVTGSLLLRPEETVTKIWHASMRTKSLADEKSGQNIWLGFLALTDRRLAFVEEVGLFTKTHRVKESIDLENLINVSVQGVLKKLYVTYQAGGNSVERMFEAATGQTLLEIQREIQKTRAARVNAIEHEKKQARVQYVLDFSFLKDQMEKGGIMVSTIRCPNCGGTLALPSTGVSVRCEHCRSDVVAQDVFERMKGLLGNLP